MIDRTHRTVAELLDDIVCWGERIPTLLDKLKFEEFERDYRTHLAVWKSVEVIGEASGRLLQAGLELDKSSLRQFRLAYEMRNRLTHGYPGIDLQVLWNTAHLSVPALIEAARSLQQAVPRDDG